MNLFALLARNLLLHLPPEQAHRLSILALKSGMVAAGQSRPDRRLAVEAAGLNFSNPLGIAAGYDKNGEVPDAIFRLGFGFAEIGTVTPRPQAGNPRPRVFRLARHQGVINRLGFNNEGYAAVLARLRARQGNGGIVGVNIGANKGSADFIADYVSGIETFWPVASYFTANISSPNTPGLRAMQAGAILAPLLTSVLGVRDLLAAQTGLARPVFLKISPDLEQWQMQEIADVIAASRLDGMIISNTTLGRAGVEGHRHALEAGGLSGAPLFEQSTIVLARMRKLLGNALPIIAVGGIDGIASAISKIEAGATLLQLYTGMIYHGPMLADHICKGLAGELNARGMSSIREMTGVKNRQWASRKLSAEA